MRFLSPVSGLWLHTIFFFRRSSTPDLLPAQASSLEYLDQDTSAKSNSSSTVFFLDHMDSCLSTLRALRGRRLARGSKILAQLLLDFYLQFWTLTSLTAVVHRPLLQFMNFLTITSSWILFHSRLRFFLPHVYCLTPRCVLENVSTRRVVWIMCRFNIQSEQPSPRATWSIMQLTERLAWCGSGRKQIIPCQISHSGPLPETGNKPRLALVVCWLSCGLLSWASSWATLQPYLFFS